MALADFHGTAAAICVQLQRIYATYLHRPPAMATLILMDESRTYHLKLLMPLYPPLPGGGAQYATFLLRHLPTIPRVASIELLTEAAPGQPRRSEAAGTCPTRIRRILARHFGLPRRVWWRYLTYALQNVSYAAEGLRIGVTACKDRPQTLVVHGAFFIHPSVLPFVTSFIKRWRGDAVRLVLDIRDPSAPVARLSSLKHFDLTVTCSRNLTERLHSCPEFPLPIEEIPVPIELEPVAPNDVSTTLSRHGLGSRPFLFTSNGIKDARAFPLIYDTWRKLTNQGHPLDLVVAGDTFDWHARYGESISSTANMYNLGRLPNREIRCLMSACAAFLNPSPVEGLPRSCLEAISAGAPTLLPPNVPEFDQLAYPWVARSSDAAVLAQQVAEMIRLHQGTPYPLDNHATAAIVSRYASVLSPFTEPIARTTMVTEASRL